MSKPSRKRAIPRSPLCFDSERLNEAHAAGLNEECRSARSRVGLSGATFGRERVTSGGPGKGCLRETCLSGPCKPRVVAFLRASARRSERRVTKSRTSTRGTYARSPTCAAQEPRNIPLFLGKASLPGQSVANASQISGADKSRLRDRIGSSPPHGFGRSCGAPTSCWRRREPVSDVAHDPPRSAKNPVERRRVHLVWLLDAAGA
jgi:mRNA-degrading endonuclease toxin of MazEF toxin-antitoxin module